MWQKGNSEALLQVLVSIEDEITEKYSDLMVASKVWNAIQHQFNGTGVKSAVSLLTKLWQEKFTPERDLNAQIQEIKETALRLSSLGNMASEDLQATALITSLPPEWNTLRTSLANRHSITLQDTIDAILNYERKGKYREEEVPVSQSRKSGKSQSGLRKDRKRPRCMNCQKRGHTIEKCWAEGGEMEGVDPKKRSPGKRPKSSASVSDGSSDGQPHTATPAVNIAATSPMDGTYFVIDSGATSHMVSDHSLFATYRTLDRPKCIRTTDQKFIKAVGIGDIKMKILTENKWHRMIITDVLHIPSVTHNLLSIRQLSSVGLSTTLHMETANIKCSKTRELIAQAYSDRSLYRLRVEVQYPEQARFSQIEPTIGEEWAFIAQNTHASEASLALWHRRLGHISEETILQMDKGGTVAGMFITNANRNECIACPKGKQTREIIPGVTAERAQEVLGRVFSEIYGPIRPETHEGYRYFATFTDDYSRYTYVGFAKTKVATLELFKSWKARAEKEAGQKLKIIRTNRGGEYKSEAFKKFLAKEGIKHEFANPKTPQGSGAAEQENGTPNGRARSMLEYAKMVVKIKNLPPGFWNYAIRHAVWIENRVPIHACEREKTPYEVYFGRRPSLISLRLFGCVAHAHIPEKFQKKTGAKVVEGIHIGFIEEENAWVLYDQEKHRIIRVRDVEFIETGSSERVRVEMDDEERKMERWGGGEEPKGI
jgi:hypothetical protein